MKTAAPRNETTGLPEKWDLETDVLVVGFGGTGGAAAIEAYDKGAKVIILEKTAKPGGNTLVSGGMALGAGTSTQKSKGIQDNAEDFFQYLKTMAGGLADEERLRLYAEKSADSIEWLIKLGVKFAPDLLIFTGMEELPGHVRVPSTKPRAHQVEELTGAGLMNPLKRAIEQRGIPVMLATPAKELITNPLTKEVIGVKTEKLNIKARRAVILATGGFSRNEDMVRTYLTAYLGIVPMCALEGIDGDGTKMAQALGADVVNMGLIEPIVQGVPKGFISISPNKKVMQLEVPKITTLKLAPCILVNKKGQRFADEFTHYTLLGQQLALQPDRMCFCIFDENTMRMGAQNILHNASDGLKKEIEEGIVIKSPTIAELAQKIGVDPDALQDTIFTFNANVEKGTDPEFGRKLHLVPMKMPPFYAMEYRPGFGIAAGGLKVNNRMEVIDVFGRVIPRLYAGGETTGGATGRYYTSGFNLMQCFVAGRIAGENAAHEKPWN